MKIQTQTYITVFGLALFLLLSPLGPVWECRADTAADRQIYADLLKKYVKQERVDYQGLKTEEQRLDRYLKTLEKTDSGKLSRKEAFAFYINVYNAWTVKLILTGYPGVKSIKDLGSLLKSPWKKKICRVDGTIRTLDYIEHEILRPRFKDPRVHFAINCAAASCPPLRSEPYEGETLERQLNDSAQAFINDPKRNYLEGNKLYASKIFKWFAADFNDDVVGFFIKYSQNDFKQRLEALKGKIKVKYLHYDWSLNGA